MTDREVLLFEAVRRLDTAYHQLWGMLCAKDKGHEACEGRKVFEGYYRDFTKIMEKVTAPTPRPKKRKAAKPDLYPRGD